MKIIISLLLLSSALLAQSIPTINVTTDPSGSCTNERMQLNTTNGKLWVCNAGTWATAGGSTVTPGGSNTQVQFNDSGAFGGNSGLTFNKSTSVLTIGTALAITGCGAGTYTKADGTGCGTPGGGTTWNAPVSITSLPSCSTAVFFQPFTDAAYNYAYCNGSSAYTYYLFGQSVTPPTGTWAWTNQVSAVVTKQTNGLWTFNFPSHGATSDSLNVYDEAIGAAPSSQVFRFTTNAYVAGGNPGAGVSLRESGTGKLIAVRYDPYTGDCTSTVAPCLSVVGWSSPTGAPTLLAAGPNLSNNGLSLLPITIKVTVATGAAGNITISYSPDNGITYFQLYQGAKNAYLTTAPDNIGVFADNALNGARDIYLTLLSVN